MDTDDTALSGSAADAVEAAEAFDFNSHRKAAEEAYRIVQASYERYAALVRELLISALSTASIVPHSIEARAKSVESFGTKSATPSETDPTQPKYSDPLAQVTDKAGCRVITFFLKNVAQVDIIINEQFRVVEQLTRSAFDEGQDRLGYESVHYIVELDEARLKLPEYSGFRSMQAEVQVRTIMQHAWAEIEHDVQYKAAETLPSAIKRRFLALAGLLEIADREFQAIADEHEVLKLEARDAIRAGYLQNVEITPESLKLYLDIKFGPDGRATPWSYRWAARNVKRMGFETLAELDRCIVPYDDDAVSRAIHGSRQGQVRRLNDVLMASMGNNFIKRHPWALEDSPQGTPPAWLTDYVDMGHALLREAGIEVGEFDPQKH